MLTRGTGAIFWMAADSVMEPAYGALGLIWGRQVFAKTWRSSWSRWLLPMRLPDTPKQQRQRKKRPTLVPTETTYEMVSTALRIAFSVC